jgi:hypothetical protein
LVCINALFEKNQAAWVCGLCIVGSSLILECFCLMWLVFDVLPQVDE